MAGNASGWRTFTITIDPTLNADTTLPTDSTAIASSAWRTAPASVTVQGSDAGSGLDHMEWRLDGQPIAARGDGHAPSRSPATASTRSRRARVDVAGNASGWKAQTIRIDTVVPVDTTARAGRLEPFARRSTSAAPMRPPASRASSSSSTAATTQTGPSGTVAAFTSDGTHTLAHRVIDQSPGRPRRGSRAR